MFTILLKKKGYYLVNENSEKIPLGPYFTKSKSEFIEKANRGRADSQFKRPVGEFYEKDKNDVYDYIMEKYVDKLKSKLNSN